MLNSCMIRGPLPPNRSEIILGDGSTKKVELIGKIDLIFHTNTEYPATLYNIPVSFMPDLTFNLISFHVVQEKQEIILKRSGAHFIDD